MRINAIIDIISTIISIFVLGAILFKFFSDDSVSPLSFSKFCISLLSSFLSIGHLLQPLLNHIFVHWQYTICQKLIHLKLLLFLFNEHFQQLIYLCKFNLDS